MNAQRRRLINDMIEELDDLKMRIEAIQEEEEAAFENMPESLQYSERGEHIQEIAQTIESAVDSINEGIDYLLTAIE